MTWGKRLLLVGLILWGMFYGILSLAERNKDALRKGIEDYLVKATGYPSEITEMTTVELTPDVVFRMKGVSVRDKEDGDKTLLHAKRAYLATPLWKMFFGQSEYIGFEIQDLEVASGFFLPKKLSANFVGISDPSPDKSASPVMMLEGSYNGHPVLVTAELKRKPDKKYYLYSFLGEFPFTFKLGPTEADGLFSRGFSSVSLKRVQMVREDQRAEFVVRNMHLDPLDAAIEGTINDVPFNATLKKTGENTVLAITADSGTDVSKIESFVAKIEDDIGLTDQDSFKITIDTSDAASSKDQEKKQEETE